MKQIDFSGHILFSPHSLWIKFFCCYIFPSLLLLFIWVTISMFKMRSSELDNILQYQQTLNAQILSALENNIDNLEQISYIIYSDSDNLTSLYKGPSEWGYYSSRNNFKQTMGNFLFVTGQIDGIALFDLKGNNVFLLDRLSIIQSPFLNVSDTDWYNNTLNFTQSQDIYKLSVSHSEDRDISIIAISRILYHPSSQQRLGVVLCFSYMDTFVSGIKDAALIDGGQFQLMDDHGTVIYDSGIGNAVPVVTKQKENYELVSLNGQTMLRSSVYGSQYGWSIISYTPLNIIQPSQFLKDTNIITVLLLIVISLGISAIISRRVTRPLSQLTDSFVKVSEGDFEAKVSIAGKDELAKIGDAYNQMLDMIRTLTKERYELKLSNMQAKLETLQSQINPHFLFNTLNSIKAVSYSGELEKVSQMIQALSDLMRYSLNQRPYIVSFSEELNIVRKYLYLQEYRFEDHYSTKYDIESAVMKMEIPSLSIQPLVENAIKHGLEPSKKNGQLIITAKVIGNNLHLYISNTGKPISAEKQKELNKKLQELSATTDFADDRIGLLNVAYRLKLHYSNHYSLKITSTDHYTTVKLQIPAKEFNPENSRRNGWAK